MIETQNNHCSIEEKDLADKAVIDEAYSKLSDKISQLIPFHNTSDWECNIQAFEKKYVFNFFLGLNTENKKKDQVLLKKYKNKLKALVSEHLEILDNGIQALKEDEGHLLKILEVDMKPEAPSIENQLNRRDFSKEKEKTQAVNKWKKGAKQYDKSTEKKEESLLFIKSIEDCNSLSEIKLLLENTRKGIPHNLLHKLKEVEISWEDISDEYIRTIEIPRDIQKDYKNKIVEKEGDKETHEKEIIQKSFSNIKSKIPFKAITISATLAIFTAVGYFQYQSNRLEEIGRKNAELRKQEEKNAIKNKVQTSASMNPEYKKFQRQLDNLLRTRGALEAPSLLNRSNRSNIKEIQNQNSLNIEALCGKYLYKKLHSFLRKNHFSLNTLDEFVMQNYEEIQVLFNEYRKLKQKLPQTIALPVGIPALYEYAQISMHGERSNVNIFHDLALWEKSVGRFITQLNFDLETRIVLQVISKLNAKKIKNNFK